ncbi:hypothetical protein PEBR_20798 [Penicillium brasilianum]|uniref:Transcription factor domain-containing protein n=1 Tax=Penicillium brasilianum TaxID=104259 RepID=A0A1S9RMG0_PENBI|nr:hypothetical protein PEBR_20798 [Penicillium brasilianum]
MESSPRHNTKNPENFETASQAEVFVGDLSEAQGGSDRVQFEFVNLIPDTTARSHAMKMYWRQKKSTRDRREKNWSDNQRFVRPLLPAKDSAVQPYVSEQLEAQKMPLNDSTTRAQFMQDTSSMGLADQLWEGLQFPFSDILFREKDSSLCQVTVEHRTLFYHWLAMHAEEIHSNLGTATISPFRDIWMPLDLSNPASFNAILAHAAAHISETQNKESNSEILRFKIEAIELVNKWLGDPTTSFKDEVFAAVLRLFTFERYRGTSERSNLHKRGLHQMVEARGGYRTFETNWRLQLALSMVLVDRVYLTPESSSCGVPVKELEEFLCDALSLSYRPQPTQTPFIQNTNSFNLVSLRNAIMTLKHKRLEMELSDGDTFSVHDPLFPTLETIIFICIAFLQERHEGHMIIGRIDLLSLESLLFASYSSWVDSERMLSELVWNQFAHRDQNLQLKNQIATITGSLSGMNPLALRGLELCLLNRLLTF